MLQTRVMDREGERKRGGVEGERGGVEGERGGVEGEWRGSGG